MTQDEGAGQGSGRISLPIAQAKIKPLTSCVLWVQACPTSMEIIFRDKPAGWLTVPSRMGASDVRPCLGRSLEAELGQRVYPIHRLDFEVSGLVLFALNPDAQRAANQWFERRWVHKIYQAVASPAAGPELVRPEDVPSLVELRLLRGKRRAYESPRGDSAVTKLRFLGLASEGLERWQLEPVTGRAHQLRVTMNKVGRPIVGDQLYGSHRLWPSGGIALRAVALNLSQVPASERRGLGERLEVPPLF